MKIFLSLMYLHSVIDDNGNERFARPPRVQLGSAPLVRSVAWLYEMGGVLLWRSSGCASTSPCPALGELERVGKLNTQVFFHHLPFPRVSYSFDSIVWSLGLCNRHTC